MCEQFSESGQPCGFVPCERCAKAEAEKEKLNSQLAFVTAGLLKTCSLAESLAAENATLVTDVQKHKDRRDHLEDMLNRSIEHEQEWIQRALKAEAENVALRQERDALASTLATFIEADAKAAKAADIMESTLSENGFDPDLGLLNALEVGGKARQELNTLQVCYKAAESSRHLAIVELNSFIDRINVTLHPDGDAPSAPSGCDLVAYVKELREERYYFRNVICHLASLLGKEITRDYTVSCLRDDIIKERNMAARIIEKADALYTASCFPLESEKINCAKNAYREARHG